MELKNRSAKSNLYPLKNALDMKIKYSDLEKLNKQALKFAREDNWVDALECINNRQLLLKELFLIESAQLIAEQQLLNKILDDIEKTDEKLSSLARDAKIDLTGKITHLSLSKKASEKYQQIASQR